MAQTIINNALQEWTNEIKNALAQLHPDEGGAVHIMSVTRRKQGIVGGVMSKVFADVAAQLIAGETHREATPEEIEDWNQEQDVKRQKQLGEAAKRDTKFNVDLGPIAEMLLKLGAAQQAAVTPAVATQSVPTPAPVEATAVSAPVVPPVTNTNRNPNRPARTEPASENSSRF